MLERRGFGGFVDPSVIPPSLEGAQHQLVFAGDYPE